MSNWEERAEDLNIICVFFEVKSFRELYNERTE